MAAEAGGSLFDDVFPGQVPLERPETDAEFLAQAEEQAARIVQAMDTLGEALLALPADVGEARRQQALIQYEQVLGLRAPAGMAREKFHAAVLVGRGCTFAEAARILGCDPGQLYQWRDAAFVRTMRHWRATRLDEWHSTLIKTLEVMLNSTTSQPLRLKIIREMSVLAAQPEDRERWMAEMHLREREVAAREKDADAYAQAVMQTPVPVRALQGAMDIEIIDVEAVSEDDG